MSGNDYLEIIRRSSELKEEFDNGLDEADKKMIDNLFSELEVFADTVNTDQIINFLDEKKFEVKDKNSESVFDIPIWAREHKFCEATFVRKFQEILEICRFRRLQKIFAKYGESSSEAAKSNQIISEDGTKYGRKLDVLILIEQNDRDDIEVCSNEFKKPDATSTMKCYQQSKNL
ncbi:hypothetical protein INT45_004981 [Circinella minor]|uniref:Uncharacterized protein n=1 Tax=Circinella minor TaxID=1195481 RepID=A0A8H7S8K4_9FUNG|nr:hypothetical protein INT45_004981 [Circinella minor]